MFSSVIFYKNIVPHYLSYCYYTQCKVKQPKNYFLIGYSKIELKIQFKAGRGENNSSKSILNLKYVINDTAAPN